jgi:predicted phosphodiesterase
VLFVGDPHGELNALIEVAREHRPRAMVLLGDLEPRTSLVEWIDAMRGLGVEAWFIHGNHDTDSAPTWQRVVEAAAWNLHGRVVEVAGVRIAGLGGVFRKSMWDPAADQAPSFASLADLKHHLSQGGRVRAGTGAQQLRRHASTIFPADIARLAGKRVDVMVTHEAPRPHRHGFQAINDLARAMGVQRLFHGHHHEHVDYTNSAAEMGFMAWGVDAGGVVDFDGAIVAGVRP